MKAFHSLMCRFMWLQICCFAIFHVSFAGEFSIATYNVQMRPLLDDNEHKGPRISPKLNKYDIVAIEESFARKELLTEAVTHPYASHFTEKRCCLVPADSGLTTLSRFPIILTKAQHYRSVAGFQDSLASKGILLTRLDINGQIVDFYNTHMQAGQKSAREKLARVDQARQVIEFVKENSPLTNSVIITGDFNMSPKRPNKDFKDFNPNHYIDEESMIISTAAFQMIIDELELTDLHDTLLLEEMDYIERVLYRSGSDQQLSPLSIEDDSQDFRDEHGEPLSDSPAWKSSFGVSPGNLLTQP